MTDTAEDRFSYRSIYSHLRHHKPRDWLLRGARDEDANTIRMAIERLSERTLCRRLARMLAKEEE
jgi:hypothetical protein